ncbi:MAG: transglutaminase domain-containing protein [Sandaracinaceae bacterium]
MLRPVDPARCLARVPSRWSLSVVSLASVLGLLVNASCGGAGPSYADFPAARAIPLTHGGHPPAVDRMVQRFYAAEGFDGPRMGEELATLLAAHPGNAAVHEMSAHLAEVREDSGQAWFHWLSAAADLDGDFARIYLSRALFDDLAVSQESASIAVLRELAREHPDPAVRVDATTHLIFLLERRGRYAEADRLGAGLDTLDAWMVIGPFDNDQGRGFHAVYGPESEIDLDRELPGLRVPVRWRRVDRLTRRGEVPLADLMTPEQWAAAYLLTHVRTEEARDVELRISTATPFRVWVNGAEILAQEHLARSATDNFVLPVRLAEGWNRILLKSAQDLGDWRVAARLTRPRGFPLGEGDVEVSAELHDVPPPERPPSAPDWSLPYVGLTPALRRDLLQHHASLRDGFDLDRLRDAQSMLEHAPRHPVALYQAALAHWAMDEMGEAIDLLNAGVDRTEGWGAGFLWQRGAFYRDRRRFDRATEDLLRAIEINPNARQARMELAFTHEAREWYEQETEVLEEVLERWPDWDWGLRALGHALQSRGYLDRAEAVYRRADRLAPGNVWNLERLATLARWRGDHEASVGHIERLRAFAPWSVDHLLTLGDYLRFAGRRDEARAAYAQAGAWDPGWALPHLRLGLLDLEDGDREGAVGAWSRAQERDPDNARLAERLDFLTGGDEVDPRLPSAARIETAVASARTLELDPGAHTVLVLDDEVTTVRNDGSATRRVTQVHLAVTNDGRDALIANGVPPRARVLQAYSVTPDGARQEASSIRRGVIRFRGLEVGSVVVLQYTVHSPPPAFLPNHFVSSWLFQGLHRQLGEGRWLVEVPAGRQLAMHVQGPVRHQVEQQGDLEVHTFAASDVPPLVSEPGMPPPRDLLAMVTLSTLTDWDEYAEWERALLSEVFEASPQVRELAARLTEGAETPRERLDRLFHYVAEEIRYQQDYETTIAGVRPHSCPVVLERGYGDCKDKAVLLILLAREVGLDVDFAILRTTGAGEVRPEVPNQQFNHAIVYVPPQLGIEEGIFMDPTTDGLDMGNLRSDDQGALSLVLDPDDGGYTFMRIPYQDPSKQFFGCDVDVDVATGESATAQARCRVRGMVGSTFRQVMRNDEQAAQLRQNVANTLFNGASLLAGEERNIDDTWSPVEIDLSLDVSPTIQVDGAERRVRVPSSFPLSRLTRLETRRTPLRLGPPESSRWRVTVQAPPRGRVARAPRSFEVEHPCFTMSRQTVERAQRVELTMTFERTCTEIAPDDYPEFRRLAQQASNQLQAEVVLRLAR